MNDNDRRALAQQIAEEVAFRQKEVLTANEAARFLGVSMSRLYKMTMARMIPYFKSPAGRFNYFNRVELENWAQSNRIATTEELNDRAQSITRR